MKLFLIFIFCLLTPLVVDAGSTQGPSNDCICVSLEFCNYQFSAQILPRSLRQECNAGNQVCCPPQHITQYPNENLNTPSSDSFPNTPQCGKSNPISNGYARLITPNYVVKQGEIPWQVAIVANVSIGAFFVSNGALLTPWAILAAAHPFKTLYPDQVRARLGEIDFRSNPSRNYPALNGKISKIIKYEDFNRNTLRGDFAVLCLKSPVKLSQTINPICLPDPGDFISDSASCVVSGWGKNNLYGNFSSVLRKSYVNLVPTDICSDLISKRVNDPNFILDQTFLCSIRKDNRDATCTGDAGSPLTCTNSNGQNVLVGISKSGIGCGERNVPGIFSNVRDPPVYEWLKTAAESCVPQNLPVDYDYQSSIYNDDYQVVNYNSNNYNSVQDYNNPSNYNQMNNNYSSNPSSNYNSDSIGYTGRSADPTLGINGFQIDNIKSEEA